MFVYKIQNASGQFSSGGANPTFSSKGKSWTSRGHLTNHLLKFKANRKFKKFYEGCKVVLFNLHEVAQVKIQEGIPQTIKEFPVFDAFTSISKESSSVEEDVTSSEYSEEIPSEEELVTAGAELEVAATATAPETPW